MDVQSAARLSMHHQYGRDYEMAPAFQTVFPADPYAPQVFRAVTNSREIDKGIAASDVLSPALVTAANPGDSVSRVYQCSSFYRIHSADDNRGICFW